VDGVRGKAEAEEEAMTDWFFGHSLEVCALSVLGALTAWRPVFVPLLVVAAGWWVLQEWRVAQVRRAPRMLETAKERT
jgi:hypothetical protein